MLPYLSNPYMSRLFDTAATFITVVLIYLVLILHFGRTSDKTPTEDASGGKDVIVITTLLLARQQFASSSGENLYHESLLSNRLTCFAPSFALCRVTFLAPFRQSFCCYSPSHEQLLLNLIRLMGPASIQMRMLFQSLTLGIRDIVQRR